MHFKNPLLGYKNEMNKGKADSAHYYTQILSKEVILENYKQFETYDLTFSHSNFPKFGPSSSVVFIMEFVPLTLITHAYEDDFYYIIVQMCGIIGGILTVAGIIDSMWNQSVVHVMKKYNMGKLS
jgi:hypothetical protein